MKLTMKRILFLVGMLLAASSSFGQDAARDAEHRDAEHRIDSEPLAGERTFTVRVPASYEAYTSSRFPVLYLLDGDTNLAHAGPVVDFLAENGKIPEMIIVAIHSGATRSQDFIPPVEGGDNAAARGEAFLSFLEGELVPFVDAEYRTAPLRVVSGHSLGGLFVTWAMARGSDVATAWLAQSPYLVENTAPGVLAEVGSGSAGSGPGGSTAYYYANLGAEPDLSANFDLLEAGLAELPTDALDWSLEREPSESHMSTRLMGLYDGLSAFFEDDWRLGSAALVEGGVDGLTAHVAGLSEQFGYPVLFSEQPFQELTQRFLQQRDMASARQAAALYVKHHDPSVVAHFMHGVALASSGERAEGLAEVNRAISLYEAAPRPELAPVYGQLQQLRNQLGGGQ